MGRILEPLCLSVSGWPCDEDGIQPVGNARRLLLCLHDVRVAPVISRRRTRRNRTGDNAVTGCEVAAFKLIFSGVRTVFSHTREAMRILEDEKTRDVNSVHFGEPNVDDSMSEDEAHEEEERIASNDHLAGADEDFRNDSRYRSQARRGIFPRCVLAT